MPKPRKSQIWDKHEDNWYVEPSWCAEALFRDVTFDGRIHDPCCGMGTIPIAALTAGYEVTASDIRDRWPKAPRNPERYFAHNFTIIDYKKDRRGFDNIVCNPPFDDINKKPWPFIEWALAHAQHKVALLVPFKWFGGDQRSRYLEMKPVSQIFILTPRPSMPPGEVIVSGEKPGGGKEDFAWVIFDRECRECECGPEIGWIHRDQDA